MHFLFWSSIVLNLLLFVRPRQIHISPNPSGFPGKLGQRLANSVKLKLNWARTKMNLVKLKLKLACPKINLANLESATAKLDLSFIKMKLVCTKPSEV